MEFELDDCGEDMVAKAVRVASIVQKAQKRADKVAKEALEVAHRELKRKEKIIEQRKTQVWKNSYFQSSRGAGVGQPLSFVFDDCLFDVPRAEPNLCKEYPNEDDGGQSVTRHKSVSLSQDTTRTPGSSSNSGDTIVLSAKSPLITISEDSKKPDNSKFVEVPVEFEGCDDDSDFESPPSKKVGTSWGKSGNSQSQAQMQ